MVETEVTVNNCYILREKLDEDAFFERWRASAIFAASEFLLRFLKKEYEHDEALINSFIEESRASRGIASPSILDIVEIDRFEGRLVLVSEYKSYIDMRSLLFIKKRFSAEYATRLVLEITEGIDAFHTHGKVYGSLTGDSIVLKRNGEQLEELKILQPSYSLLIAQIKETDAKAYLSHWTYLAPEQKKSLSVDTRADIYSLGLIMFTLIMGKLPYGKSAGNALRDLSASPTHIAHAFARRDLPRELALIAVKMLRKNPKNRYQDTVRLISDLRVVLDSRRESRLRSGLVDPIADLATLNLKKAQAGAHEIVRSLDAVDYFRFLSEATANNQVVSSIHAEGQIKELDPDLEAVEEKEALLDDDDDKKESEAYVKEAYAQLGKSAPNKKPIESKPEKVTGKPVVSKPIVIDNSDFEDTTLTAPLPKEDVVISRSKREQSKVKWTPSGGPVEKIAEEILKLRNRAASGTGSVRFIEDPLGGTPARLISESLAACDSNSFMVDLGSLRNGINLESFLTLLNVSCAQAISELDGRTRKSLAKRLLKFDPDAYLRRGALALILNIPEEEIPLPAEIDGNVLIQALRAFARHKKPLVLVARSVEAVDRSTHDFLIGLATEVKKLPICAYLFFIPGKAPAWHVLSTLPKH